MPRLWRCSSKSNLGRAVLSETSLGKAARALPQGEESQGVRGIFITDSMKIYFGPEVTEIRKRTHVLWRLFRQG